MKKTLLAAVALLGLCGRAAAFTTSTPVQLDAAISESVTRTAVSHLGATIFLDPGQIEVVLVWSYSANGAAQPGGCFSFSSTLTGNGLPATGSFDRFFPMVSGVEYKRTIQVPATGMWLYIADRSGNEANPSGLLASNAFIWVEKRKAFGHTPANTR